MPIFPLKNVAAITSGCCLMASLLISSAIAEEVEDPAVVMLVLEASLSKTESAQLSLKEALKIAQAENQTHLAALAEVKEAKARYITRLTQFLPDFSISQPFVNYEGHIQTATGTLLRVKRTNYQPQLVFRFSLLPKGAQILAAKVAKKELDAQQEIEQSILQNILRQTSLAYYDLQRRMQDIVIAQQLLAETEANVALNQWRLQTGTGSPQDVLQAQAQQIDAKSQYVEAARATEASALRLNELLNLPAFAEVAPKQAEQQIQTLVPTHSSFQVLITEAVERNPRIIALRKRMESLTQLFKPTNIAIALMPELYTQYRTGRTGMSGNLSEMARFDERSYGIGFTYANMGITSLVQYKGIRAQIARLHAQLEAERNLLERELSEDWLTAKAQQFQLEIAREKVGISEAMLKDAIEQLKTRTGRNIDVLNAQTNLNLARLALNATITEYNQAQVDLVYGMGLASVDTLTGGMP